METKKISISKIKKNPKNPRLIKDSKFDKLVKSIQEFPQMLEIRPIVVNTDMVILGGNMRFEAAKKAGLKEVSIIIADQLTADQQAEFIIKDNVGFGDWDWDMLANEWDEELLEDWGLDLPDYEELNENNLESIDDDYNIPNEIETDIKIGDIFNIGCHKLICGDSTLKETFELLFEDKIADLVITDPPYNVSYKGKTKDSLTIMNDSMSSNEFYNFLFDFYKSLSYYVKPGCGWYIFHADSEGHNFRSAMINAGIMVKQCLIWVKNSMVLGRQDYHWKHEPCLYGWKEGAAHNWYSDRKQTTILEFDRPQRNSEHPTMKPVELIGYLIKNSSKIGDIVVDAFGGSGTTMIACNQLNRVAYLVEYDPKYCQVIIDRMIKQDPDIEIIKNGIKIK